MIFVIGLAAGLISTLSDYEKHAQEANAPLYSLRLQKRAALIFVPFVMNVPYSLETIMHPSRLLVEPGLLISGGGPINALLGNPGGANSLPIWLVSPILLVLIVSLFSINSCATYR